MANLTQITTEFELVKCNYEHPLLTGHKEEMWSKPMITALTDDWVTRGLHYTQHKRATRATIANVTVIFQTKEKPKVYAKLYYRLYKHKEHQTLIFNLTSIYFPVSNSLAIFNKISEPICRFSDRMLVKSELISLVANYN